VGPDGGAAGGGEVAFFAFVDPAACLWMIRRGFVGEGFCAVAYSVAGGAAVVSAGGVVVFVGGGVVCCCGAGSVTVGACAWGGGTAGFFFLHPAAKRTTNARASMAKRE